MDQKLFDHIENEVKKSGHPVSLKASMILNKEKWLVETGVRYTDGNEKLAEIDIIAKRKSNFLTHGNDQLIIECKKQLGKNWVFFKQHKRNRNHWTLCYAMKNSLVSDFYNYIKDNDLFKKHHYWDKSLCTFYFISDINHEHSEQSKLIDKAIDQCMGALSFYGSRHEKFFNALFLFYPIIVFDGNLFEVDIGPEGVKIEESNHVSLLIHFDSKEPLSVTPSGNQLISGKPFIIDIVKLSYFEEFLKNFN
ncbi:MAG: hypothetical protein MUO21_04515 [Nitrososphaeraceae archaeon]|nr:hypothetical protein [Nitrososphaeraceae archaeon]